MMALDGEWAKDRADEIPLEHGISMGLAFCQRFDRLGSQLAGAVNGRATPG